MCVFQLIIVRTHVSTNTFKARLDKFWHNQDVVYDFKAQLQGNGSRSECLYGDDSELNRKVFK